MIKYRPVRSTLGEAMEEQSGKVQEEGVDYYILEVTRLKKDYTLYRGRCRNKFIQVCDDEINIMQDSSAQIYCDIYNSRKTYLG